MTSTAGEGGTPSDVSVAADGVLEVTGTAVTVDSDNNFTNNGTIQTEGIDDTVGVHAVGGNSGNITNNGSISLDEATDATLVDGVLPAGADITTGSGRTGILISGASPFIGNIDNTSNGSIVIRGQDSHGIHLETGSVLDGNILQNGFVSVYGERSIGLNLEGDITGGVTVGGNISSIGEDSRAIRALGNIAGGIAITSDLTSSGYVTGNGLAVTTRPNSITRDAILNDGSPDQVGSIVEVRGNVDQGLHFGTVTNEDGVITALASVTMAGSAPAILVNGDGTPIAIGKVGQITDPDDEDYDEDLLYAFVNQGTLTTSGVLDDIDATLFSVSDATLDGGINNAGAMGATVFRSGVDPDGAATTNNAHARVIVIGGGAIAEQINNAGTILAQGFEAIDTIYIDRDNIPGPNLVFATAVEIGPGGSLDGITNLGTISAVLTARNGEVVAIRDKSGTLITINNSGTISARGISSDSSGEQATNFNEIALDLAANTVGVTITQTIATNPDDADELADPLIRGDIYLGSGNDLVDIQGGRVTGDIDFGGGVDSFALSDGATFTGGIEMNGGTLSHVSISGGSRMTVTASGDIDTGDFLVDATSVYSPFIDPDAGEVSMIRATGTLTFEDGSTITPTIANVFSNPAAMFTIASAGILNIDTALASIRSENSPFLYNTEFERSSVDPNTLTMTLDLRSTSELGLDTVQTAAFTSAFEALVNSNALGAAFVGITNQADFYSAYNQLLPEFSGAARQFVLANVDGATGAVASHLDNARHSQERPGGAWIQEFVYYADRDLQGFSEQFRGFGFGITGGFDTSFGPFHTAGVNIGFATTEVEDVLGQDDPLDVLTLQAGLYAGYETGNLGVDLYAGFGYDDYETNRRVIVGLFDESAKADWTGTHINASARAGYEIGFGRYFVRPSATVSYLRLSEKEYTETGSQDIALMVDKRTSDVVTATAQLDFGAFFQGRQNWYRPALRAGYRNDFINQNVITTGQFVGGTTPFSLTSEVFPESGFLLGVTFASGSDFSSFAFDYDADIRSGFIRHTARLVLRLLF